MRLVNNFGCSLVPFHLQHKVMHSRTEKPTCLSNHKLFSSILHSFGSLFLDHYIIRCNGRCISEINFHFSGFGFLNMHITYRHKMMNICGLRLFRSCSVVVPGHVSRNNIAILKSLCLHMLNTVQNCSMCFINKTN